MIKGKYTRDFYLIPTILIHNGDGLYKTIELAWLKWYIGFSKWNMNLIAWKEKGKHNV